MAKYYKIWYFLLCLLLSYKIYETCMNGNFLWFDNLCLTFNSTTKILKNFVWICDLSHSVHIVRYVIFRWYVWSEISCENESWTSLKRGKKAGLWGGGFNWTWMQEMSSCHIMLISKEDEEIYHISFRSTSPTSGLVGDWNEMW